MNEFIKNKAVDILLIEDNMNDAELTIRSLRKAKINNNLIHLKNGAEAIDFLFGNGKLEGRENRIQPKLILLDLKMPKIDGLEVLSRIKSDPLTKSIPVVILTSSKEHPDIEGAYTLGANSYIVKPVEYDEFAKVISNLSFYWLLMNQSHD
jgi:two-component system response regulator